MKTVFTNDMIPHLWAQQSDEQTEARSGNGNYHFEGPALYSYRQVIGVICAVRDGGPKIAFLNSRTYSITTTRHQSRARGAVSHYENHHVSPEFLEALRYFARREARGDELRAALKDFAPYVRDEMNRRVAQAWECLQSAHRSIKHTPGKFREMVATLAEAEALAKLFRVRFTIPAELRKAWAAGSPELKAALAVPYASRWRQEYSDEAVAAFEQATAFLASRDNWPRAEWKAILDRHFEAEKRERARERARLELARQESAKKEARRTARVLIERIRNPLDWEVERCQRVLKTDDSAPAVAMATAANLLQLANIRPANICQPLREALTRQARALEPLFLPLFVANEKRRMRMNAREAIAEIRFLMAEGPENDSCMFPPSRHSPEFPAVQEWARRFEAALHTLAESCQIVGIGMPGTHYYALSAPLELRVVPALYMRQARNAEVAFAYVNGICKAERARLARLAQQAKDREQFERWQEGLPVACPGSYHTSESGGVHMRRVERNGQDVLQTSRGAEVPFAHAVKVFRVLKAMRLSGRTWQRNGRIIRVGHFTVDRIDSDGSFTAGCHDFKWPEIEALARREGVFDETPDESAIETREHA